MTPSTSSHFSTHFAHTRRYDRGGNLVVCDSLKGLIMLEGAAQAAAAQRARLRAAAAAPPSTSPSGTAAADVERAAAAAAADAPGEADGAGAGRQERHDPTIALEEGSGAEAKMLSRPRIVILSNRVSRSSPMEPDTPITYANDLDISPTTGQVRRGVLRETSLWRGGGCLKVWRLHGGVGAVEA